MSEQNSGGDPESDYTNVSVPDDDLPEDLQPSEENPLAGPADADGDDAELQDMGDPHIEGLERDSDDGLTMPDPSGGSQGDDDGTED